MKGKIHLRYRLTDLDNNSLGFQILEQSSEVTKYLKKNVFLCKETGLFVASSNYPEYKHSRNTIYLRGRDTNNDFKIDVTRFVGGMQYRNEKELFVKALKNFVAEVKRTAEKAAAKAKASEANAIGATTVVIVK